VPGEIKVEVYEPGGGMSGDWVTWTLREEQASDWLTSGWFLGPLTQDPQFGQSMELQRPGGPRCGRCGHRLLAPGATRRVSEDWGSGPESYRYVVVLQDGQFLVDERR